MLSALFALLAVAGLAIVAHRTGAKEMRPGRVTRALESRWILAAIFVATFVLLWFAWGAVQPIPVVHDEMSYVLEAQILARGHWGLPSPPLPVFWEQPHVLVDPVLTSKYFPGHPLMLSIGALVGWVPLMPLVLNALSAVLLFVLARRVASGAVAVLAWNIWLFSPMVLYFGPSYYSEATTTLCWLAGWYALLEWRRTRAPHWLVAVAVCTGWDAITRPLTGVAYAIPIAAIVLRDAIKMRIGRQLVMGMLAGSIVIAILPVWSKATTGQWSTTPLALYTKLYMPYDTPGFGLNATPPAREVTPDLRELNKTYASSHVGHTPAALPRTLLERAWYLSVSIWGTSSGVLMTFALIGLFALPAEAAFAVATGIVLLLTYLLFATPASWTLYYYESAPAYAFLSAVGLALGASMIGRPRGVASNSEYSWRSTRWSRAILTAAVILLMPALGWTRVVRVLHINDRRFLVGFANLVESIHDEKAVVFVRYGPLHNPHRTFVRNLADPKGARIWVVYDRGDRENAGLLALAPGRTSYLFDEAAQHLYVYDPRAAAPR